ncbi:MHYT domain-containing protein [Streptomyces ortus]|uniref:MHYT domain-containing protein n=1 Tax=Streptomyces ortus TaxID=2867268 RepID=A0ABT3UX57_9ACTN|nr:MHYT domain-containing protein [Streptomyces ortus]MCX4231918.1 hypothetical protein [Streptomyces ortus]
MQGTVDGFSYGMITPLTAYVMACLGAALGLRCITRSLRDDRSWRPGWLALGAASIGCGIWTMHFIAMIGFQVEESRIHYDTGLTILSLAVAIAVVGLGVLAVGCRGANTATLLVAGTFTGLGVAAMHYIGMAAIRLNGDLRYEVRTVALSVLIAVVAATAALWAAVAIRGFLTSLAAGLVMGVAVTGMHYTGMAAVSVHLHVAVGTPDSGDPAHSLLLPMLIGPVLFLALAGVVVMFDPMLVLGDGDWNRAASRRRTPAPNTQPPTWSGSAFDARPGTDRRGYGPGTPGRRDS